MNRLVGLLVVLLYAAALAFQIFSLFLNLESAVVDYDTFCGNDTSKLTSTNRLNLIPNSSIHNVSMTTELVDLHTIDDNTTDDNEKRDDYIDFKKELESNFQSCSFIDLNASTYANYYEVLSKTIHARNRVMRSFKFEDNERGKELKNPELICVNDLNLSGFLVVPGRVIALCCSHFSVSESSQDESKSPKVVTPTITSPSTTATNASDTITLRHENDSDDEGDDDDDNDSGFPSGDEIFLDETYDEYSNLYMYTSTSRNEKVKSYGEDGKEKPQQNPIVVSSFSDDFGFYRKIAKAAGKMREEIKDENVNRKWTDENITNSSSSTSEWQGYRLQLEISCKNDSFAFFYPRLAILANILACVTLGLTTYGAYGICLHGKDWYDAYSLTTVITGALGVVSTALWVKASFGLFEQSWRFWPFVCCYLYVFTAAIPILGASILSSVQRPRLRQGSDVEDGRGRGRGESTGTQSTTVSASRSDDCPTWTQAVQGPVGFGVIQNVGDTQEVEDGEISRLTDGVKSEDETTPLLASTQDSATSKKDDSLANEIYPVTQVIETK